MSIKLYGWEEIKTTGDLKRRRNYNRDEKLISIVIPTLNQCKTLEHTLLSIINQDYDNFEIIVMDGGSTDGTAEVINRYSDWIYHYSSAKDAGQSQAINKGFSLASGDIYAWINSDDFYLPGAFRKVVATFKLKRSTDVVIGAGQIVTEDCVFLKKIEPMKMIRGDLIQWHRDKWIMQQSCFWSSGIWKKCGGVDEKLNLLMDYDLWLRFSEIGISSIIEDVIAVMRYYPDTKTVKQRKNLREEEAYVYAKNGEYGEVRRVVSGLIEQNQRLGLELKKRDQNIITRVLRRLYLYP